MWQGARDSDYVCDRLRIGLVHDRVDLELKWYLGGYRLYLDSLRQQLFGANPASALYDSVLKAVFSDMALTIDAYSSAQRRAILHAQLDQVATLFAPVKLKRLAKGKGQRHKACCALP